jgi:hypothetical protein
MARIEIITDAQTGQATVRELTDEEFAALMPAPRREAMRLSFAQLLIGMVAEGWVTAAEGRAWRDRVSLPAPVVALIDSLPEDQQFAAETKALAPSIVLRLDPLVVSLGAATGKTEAEIDTFFLKYGAV